MGSSRFCAVFATFLFSSAYGAASKPWVLPQESEFIKAFQATIVFNESLAGLARQFKNTSIDQENKIFYTSASVENSLEDARKLHENLQKAYVDFIGPNFNLMDYFCSYYIACLKKNHASFEAFSAISHVFKHQLSRIQKIERILNILKKAKKDA